ncbi:MAG: fibronectin type III domain-containing protein, partial [Elusimicrobiota bacterium]|nr:fibronectin type III domain-containing protein [Elusimicrobiota bacterium]
DLSPNTYYTRYGEAYKTTGSSWSSGLTICTLAYPPELVTTTSVDANTIDVSWNDSGATKYLIARSTSNFDAPWSTSAVISAGTTHQDTGLSGNSTYWYRIYVYNKDNVINNNFYSPTVSTITYPTAPTGFPKQSATPTSITWQWDTVSCDGYRIYRATDNSLIADVGASTSYRETGLSVNTAYGRFVRAYNMVGESLDSNKATFYTLSVAPVNLQVTEVYSSSVTLTWESGGNPAGTKFGLARAHDENFTVRHTTFVGLTDNLTALTTVATGLGGDTTYYFRMWAYNGDGIESDYSDTTSTKTLPGAPGIPTNFNGIAISTEVIKWEWDITPNATYYQFYDGGGVLIANLEGNGNTTYFDVALSSNTQYSRYVKAGNDYGLSDSSSLASRYTLAYPPEILTATAVSSSTINLEWNNSGAFKYEIKRSSDAFATSVIVSTTPQTSYNDINLTAGVTYYYRVYAVNHDSITTTDIYSPQTSTRTFPSPVLYFSTYSATTTSITWEWTTATGADGYRIYRAADNSVVADLSANLTYYTEPGLSVNTAYGRYVRAFNTTGLGDLSPKTTVHTLANPPAGLTVTDVTYNSISLSWSANDNPFGTRYEVSQSTDNFVTNFSTPITLADNYISVSAEIDSLTANTTYWFRVRAFNGDNLGTAFSNIVSTKTDSYQLVTLIDESFEGSFPPDGWWTNSASTGATQSGAQKKTGSYSVLFNNKEDRLITPKLEMPVELIFWLYATTGTQSFIIEQSPNMGGPWTQVANFTDELGLWQQKTVDLSGYTNVYISFRRGYNRHYYIDDVTITGYIIPDTNPPAAISNLTALTGTDEGTVILNWTSPGDDGTTGTLNDAKYRIKYSITSFTFFTKTDAYDMEFSTTGVTPGTAVSYVISGLKPGTSYYFGIITKDDAGNWSTWTKDAQTNTANRGWALDLPPQPPRNLTALSSNCSVIISWQHPSPDPGDIDKYWVYQATFSFSALTDGNVVHVATISYSDITSTTIGSLTNGTTYYYRIKTLDKGDTGDGYYGEVLVSTLSVIVSAMPRIRPPSNLVAKHNGTYVTLRWDASPDAVAPNFGGYNIYRSSISVSEQFYLIAQITDGSTT